jgi:phospholipase/carboxylesterase
MPTAAAETTTDDRESPHRGDDHGRASEGAALTVAGPHRDQPLVRDGTPLADASVAVVLVHGRGRGAARILETATRFVREGVALLAPQASEDSWYPERFVAPVAQNEPGLSSALESIDEAVQTATAAGVPRERVVVLGFSQGACLAGEYAARNPARYGGVVVLSGGLVGPELDPTAYEGDLAGTPVFLGCSDEDPHIDARRVRDSAAVFERLRGDVTTRIYSGMDHTVTEDEVAWVAALLDDLLA